VERDKTTFRFDENGRLISISDRVRTSESEDVGDGNRIRFFYTGAARLSVITDSLGHRINLAYYPETAKPGEGGAYPDLIKSVTDHTNREVLYSYDDKGRLIEVALPEISKNATGSPFAGGTRRKLDYKYLDVAAGADPKHTLHESNNLIRVTNARGQEVLAIDYDDALGFGAKEAVVKRTIAGLPERFTYALPSTTTFTDRRGHTWSFVHDVNGHPTSMTLGANDVGDANAVFPAPVVVLPGGAVPPGPFVTTTSFTGNDGLTDKVTLPSGRNAAYAYEAPGATDRRNRANVTSEQVGGPSVASPQTDQYAYQPILNLVKSHTDPTGATTTFDRDPQKGFVNKVTGPKSIGLAGATPAPGLDIGRDASTGQPTSVADFAGVGSTLVYFDNTDPAYGYLKSATEQAAPGSIYQPATPSVTSFRRDARGNVLAVTNPRGITTTFDVNEADQIVGAVLADSSTNPDAPALSIQKTFEYDADGNLVKETWPQAPLGTITRTHAYDALNRRTSTTEGGTSAAPAATTIQYDSVGNVVLVTQPEGEQDVAVFDARNLLVAQQRQHPAGSASSSVRSLTRDEDGRVLEDFDGVNTRTAVHYDGLGRQDRITTPRGAQIAIEYDNANRPTHVTVTDPGSGAVLKERRTDYAENGQVARQTELLRKSPADAPVNVVTSFFYDLGGRLLEVADPLGRTSLRGYDDHGRLRRVQDPAGNVSVVDFDEGGNPVKRTDSEIKPDGSYEADRVEQSRFDALNRTVQSRDPLLHATSFAYDEPGNLLSVTDALSHKTSYAYDERGRRLSMVDAVGNTGAPDQHKTQWAWDRSSRMLSMTDAEGRATTYTYDVIGRLTDIGYPDNQHEKRTWNGDGTVATATDQDGTISTFTYGPDDQPEIIAYTKGSGVVGLTSETFAYDKLGRLTSASSDAGIGGSPHATSRAYDSLDRVLSETQDARTIARAYDLVGNPTGLTLPGSNRSFARAFDVLDRLSQYDELLDPSGTTRRTVRAFDYVGPNRIAAERVMGGARISYEYDTARRLTRLTASNSSLPKPYLDELFGWADDDVPVFEQRLHESGRGDVYRHDEDHRLTLAALSQADPTGPPVTPGRNQQAFTLGAVHERTNDALTLATVTNSRPVASNPRYGYTDYGPDTGRTYDKAGSLTKDAHGTYQWDARHRLVEVDLVDGTRLLYGYDALGRRVEKKKALASATTTTTWLYDGWNATEEFRDGTLVRDTLYGPALDDALELRLFGPTPHDFEFLRDSTGSTAALVADDSTAQQFKYLPFGKTSLVDGSGDYSFDLSTAPVTSLWQGLELDPDLGWYYARNRWYDPETAAFVSTDPLGYPDSGNSYVWGVAEPREQDPMGFAVSTTKKGIVISDERRDGQWYFVPWDLAYQNPASTIELLRRGGLRGDRMTQFLTKNYFSIPSGEETARAFGIMFREESARSVRFAVRGEMAVAEAELGGRSVGFVAKKTVGLVLRKAATAEAGPVLRTLARNLGEVGGDASAAGTYEVGDVLPDGRVAGEGPGARLGTAAKLYRYVGEGEADVIRRTGRIPNVDRLGNPKDVYITDRLYETAGRAKTHLQLPNRPVYRIEIDPRNVPNRTPLERIDPKANPQWGIGGGTESVTRDEVVVDPSTLTRLRGGNEP
jgi:RHS repeat-associated protein